MDLFVTSFKETFNIFKHLGLTCKISPSLSMKKADNGKVSINLT
jgi:hypothetical protein